MSQAQVPCLLSLKGSIPSFQCIAWHKKLPAQLFPPACQGQTAGTWQNREGVLYWTYKLSNSLSAKIQGEKKDKTALIDVGGAERHCRSVPLLSIHCREWEMRWFSSTHHCCNDATALMQCVCFQVLCLAVTQNQYSTDAYLLSPCSSILSALWHLPAQLAAEYDTAIPIIHSSPPSNPPHCFPGDLLLITL